MLRKLLALILFVGAATVAAAQSGTLKGTVTEKSTGEPIPLANIIIKQDGQVVNGGAADFDGNYTIKPLNPGTYTVEVSYIGFATQPISGVLISPNKIDFLNVALTKENEVLGEVEVIVYDKPLIDPDKTGEIRTKQEIQNVPQRDVASLASATAGVFQADDGGGINVRGSRADATDVYIDGIKVRGSNNLPQSAIEQMQVITGGLPAQFGDATGGIISITTSGPSRVFRGGAELNTSEMLDGFGQSLAAVNASGPLIRRNDEDRTPIVGYFLAAEGQYQKDPRPSAIGVWKVKDDVLADLQSRPIIAAPNGAGTVRRAEYINDSDLEFVKRRPNSQSADFTLSGKFDVKPSENSNLTLGGSYAYNNSLQYNFNNQLFNYNNNADATTQDWRAFARFRQSFNASEESTIKNAFYYIQVDYSNNKFKRGDDVHGDNVWNYGYIGKFETFRARSYGIGSDTLEDGTVANDVVVQTGFSDTLVTYTASDLNPDMSAYTNSFFDIVGDNRVGNYQSLIQIQQGGGLRNGDSPQNIYSLWSGTGTQFNLYQFNERSQFRVVGQGSADIKDHAIQLGFEFEQRSDRSYGINPRGLWTVARQYMNRHIDQLDKDNPMGVYSNDGVFQDTINYDRLYNGDLQSTFDRNFRQSLNKSVTGTEFIDIDSYSPEDFDIDMFSAKELTDAGLVGYYGYDYTGERINGKRSIEEFFNGVDENGNFTREVGAFEPIYVAGYIQDKFAFRDLLFNIGVRVDRFDANQPVLRDPFTIFPAYTVSEAPIGRLAEGQRIPESIGDDYVVYVAANEADNVRILGYRSGNKWFDANGDELIDPKQLADNAASGQITPWLKEPDKTDPTKDITANSFEDYTPQVNIMPRISFSFPISDEAQFFAHYDVLTQRPSAAGRFDPFDYLNILSQGQQVANPNLRPERTVDYEVGFKQVLNKRSALTISGFYRELRDMIQITNLNYAHPITYITYDNLDFGTVKGFSFAYDLRRTGNVQLTANYTLQFADGSGSSATTGASLINSGQPNLRTIQPLSFDQRHAITTIVDYRYGSGSNYNGPKIGGMNILENAGANFQFRLGSGTPYSKQDNVTQAAAFGIAERSQLAGTVNGARKPFQFRIDARFDKSFNVTYGDNRKANFNVYLQVQNLLDNRNIINVYRYTGNADDDGYLSSALGESAFSSKQDLESFKDQYRIKVNNPGNYSLPRRIRLGVNINF